MAVIRMRDPNAPVVPKKKRKRYDDDLSIQPASKMISERIVKHGKTKMLYLFISFPAEDGEMAEELRELVPTVVKSDRLKDFFDFASGKVADDEPPLKLVEYRVPHTIEHIEALYKFGKANRFVFDGDMAVRALAATEEGRELERMSYAKTTTVFETCPMALKPYPFQVPGAHYMVKTKKCIVADEMGLGKTIEAILATATAKAYPVLFIVPSQLKTSPWKKEWNKWAPRRRSTTVIADNHNIKSLHRQFRAKKRNGKGYESKKWEVIIVNYDRLGKYMKYLKKIQFKAVVLDESHYCKNPMADRTKFSIELIKHVKPEYVWLLSGTPIKAKPEHLIAQLQIIDRLKDFGGRGNFMKRYCFGGANVEDEYLMDELNLKELARKKHETSIELNKHLRSLCYIRRIKAEVLHDLPAKTRTTLTFKLNAEHRAIYTQIETDLVSYLMERALKDEKFIESIKKLSKKDREFAIQEYRAQVEYQSMRAEVLQKIAACKKAATAGKLEQIKERVESFLESDEKLVLFGTHRMFRREMEAAFPGITMTIEGGQDKKAHPLACKKFGLDSGATVRDLEVARFQRGTCKKHDGPHDEKDDCISFKYIDKKCKLALCSIQAGGVGHTLTAASNVAFMELPWGPTDCDQAEDRCHRIGQKDNVTCHYWLAADTIDETIAELIESKRLTVNAVHDGDPLHGMEAGSILHDLLKALTKGKVILLR